ncbi:MAG: hypothetical protein PHH30_02090, partial [Bacteroidales bacterium]|nr:hypothetical protein [Bacteroidales bacterium]
MKKIMVIIFALILLFGCKKREEGTLICMVEFTSTINKSMTYNYKHLQTKDNTDSLYSEFGDYITSITPYRFSTKIMQLQFSDDKIIFDGGHKLQLIHGETPNDDPQRYADFSNNTTLSFVPSYSGGTETFFNIDEIEFIYFQFMFCYFLQEFAIPSQYDDVNLSQFNGQYCNNIY